MPADTACAGRNENSSTGSVTLPSCPRLLAEAARSSQSVAGAAGAGAGTRTGRRSPGTDRLRA